jgi:hypothetical protein
MTKVIIHSNERGGVSITYPTGEISIEAVLAKDCPDHAAIIDDSLLPAEEDDFFDAWELNDGAITVNLDKARAVQLARFNAAAGMIGQARLRNTAIGIANTPDDAAWFAELAGKRAAIAAAETTAALRAVIIESIN